MMRRVVAMTYFPKRVEKGLLVGATLAGARVSASETPTGRFKYFFLTRNLLKEERDDSLRLMEASERPCAFK